MLDGSAVSYGELEAGAGRLAALLRAKGVGAGDRVAVQSAKSIEAVMLYLATLKVGAVFLPLNTAYTPAEIDYFVRDAEPALFVTDAVALAAEAAGAGAAGERSTKPTRSDLAAIVYTSGTTGRSKGAMLSHGALAANGLALTEAWGFTSRRRAAARAADLPRARALHRPALRVPLRLADAVAAEVRRGRGAGRDAPRRA